MLMADSMMMPYRISKNPSASEAKTNVPPEATAFISGNILHTVNWELSTIIRESMKRQRRNWKPLFPPPILPWPSFI